MVFLSACWSVSSLGQRSRCSSSVVESGIWQTVNSLDSYMPVFLKWAARQSCPVLSLKFATASFLGLPLYSAQILKISLYFFVAASSTVSCLYLVAILRFKRFFSESACNGDSLACNVVPSHWQCHSRPRHALCCTCLPGSTIWVIIQAILASPKWKLVSKFDSLLCCHNIGRSYCLTEDWCFCLFCFRDVLK